MTTRHQAPSNGEAFKARAALFHPDKPTSWVLSGNVGIPVEQLQGFMNWLAEQKPDHRGNIRMKLVFWDQVKRNTQERYLSGYLQPMNEPNEPAEDPYGRQGTSPTWQQAAEQSWQHPSGQPPVWGQPASPPQHQAHYTPAPRHARQQAANTQAAPHVVVPQVAPSRGVQPPRVQPPAGDAQPPF